ncbi:MAG TPA: LysE family translocator [Gammaproteobacteria bacterium]|jgi:threonine/homoserine/homoserine lactone efflux protein|nr:LysE family translocator [bacterium]HAU69129.1 LysE family translocator [Gammaproteobacteria bacterium]
MPFETYIAYVLTVLIFMLAPGPSHLLMLSTSMAEGAQRSLFTAVGDLSANVLQIVLVSLGIAYLFNLQSGVVEVFQYMGVVYLAWVGVNLFRTAYKDKPGVGIASPTSGFTLWLRGFVTSASNPKALVFFASLFPQFISTGNPIGQQVLILGASYIVIDGAFLASYAFGGSRLTKYLGEGNLRLVQTMSATSILIIALVLLWRLASG